MASAESKSDSPRGAEEEGESYMYGDTRSVNIRHISYLMRQGETNIYNPSDGRVYRTEARPFNPDRQPLWLAIYAIGTFALCFMVLAKGFALARIDATIASFLWTHVVLYFIVYYSTGVHAKNNEMVPGGWGGMYRSWGVVDGYNSIARFTYKLGIEPAYNAKDAPKLSFVESNMPSSISSSVSTRGSTLNKLMLGVSFSLGVGLFVKFIQMPVDPTNSWTNFWNTLTAFAYICVVFTGLYENRTFDLDEAKALDLVSGEKMDNPIKHHRDPKYLRAGEAPRLVRSVADTKGVYTMAHTAGVFMFVILSFICHIGNSMTRSSNLSAASVAAQDSALRLSFVSCVCGAAFFTLNQILNDDSRKRDPATKQFPAETRFLPFLRVPATRNVNIYRGITCIFIEFTTLITSCLAGVIWQHS